MRGGPLFMGVDLGSQSLKLFLIDDKLEPVLETSVAFDKDLPHYQTTGGFHISGTRVTGPTVLWVEALERCFAQMQKMGAPLDRVVAVSGSAQQHGSVYWKHGALKMLQELDPSRSLTEQLGGAFAVTESPVWMDSSTTDDCHRLEAVYGGAAKVASVTGSRAFERFTGNQIAKLLATQPEAMAECERISLISSFLASLLVGGYAPIDASDGSGMNLLDINTRNWCPELVSAVSSRYPGKYNLCSRLGGVVPSYAPVGFVSDYYATRFGLSRSCVVVAFSGDNNNALIGLKLQGADLAVSMGTSDTIFASLKETTPREVGHVFAHPVIPGAYMAMLCYANGSLTREKVRDATVGKSWPAFEDALRKTRPGNNGNIGFYFLNREIIPQGVQGVYRFGPSDEPMEAFSADQDVRAVVEGQFLSMRLHSKDLGLQIGQGSRIFVTGGGSRSLGILQVLADVFGCSVMKDTKGAANSAAFGAALRAKHAYTMSSSRGHHEGDSERIYSDMISSQQTFELLAEPREEYHACYTAMLDRYKLLEARVVRMSASSKL